MPSTAPGVDLYDVSANIRFGVNLLAYLYSQFGNWSLAVAAYNCGERCVSETLAGRRRLPDSTVAYAQAVTGRSPGVSADAYSRSGYASTGTPGVVPARSSSAGSGTLWAALGISALAVAVLG